MNFNALPIIVSLIIILAVPYLISVVKRNKNHNIPLFKALNLFYTKEMHEADELRSSLKPIADEMETQRMAKFIKYWTDKFENGRLSEQDVVELNVKIADGAADQVNGILAIHPEGRRMFNQINEAIIEREAALTAAGAAAEVMA